MLKKMIAKFKRADIAAVSTKLARIMMGDIIELL